MIVKAALCAYTCKLMRGDITLLTSDAALDAAPGQMFQLCSETYIKLKDASVECLDPDDIETLIRAEERSAIELEIEKTEQRLKELRQQAA